METETIEEKAIRRKLYRVLRKTGIDKECIQPSASFIDDLNFDKVDWTIFTFYLERIFNISVEDTEFVKFGSVDDTLHYLKSELIFMNN